MRLATHKTIIWFGSFLLLMLVAQVSFAQTSLPQINLSINGAGGQKELATSLKIFILITFLSLGPSLLLTMTSFTRFVIVLSFIRQAIGIHQSPPNQIIIGLSLFLTFFVMGPVFKQINVNAVQPFLSDKIDYQTALTAAQDPLKKFMFVNTKDPDLNLLLNIAKADRPKNLEELSFTLLVPSFILSELRMAFEISFLIYLPFVLIDMIISMVLLAMGMMMVPPVVISLPFKLMLFVLVDGWNLIIGSLARSYV